MNSNIHYMFCRSFALLFLIKSATSVLASGSQSCDYKLVETIPDGMMIEKLPFEILATQEVFLDLIRNAKSSIQIASFYLTLLPKEPEHAEHPSAKAGRDVFEALESAARDRQVSVEIIVGMNWSTPTEMERLKEAGIEFKLLDLNKFFGNGVQHAKFIVTDQENLYLGSANLDWRALTHVQEFGILYNNCPILADDLSKIFKTYSFVNDRQKLPMFYPPEFNSAFSKYNQLKLMMDGVGASIYVGAGPKAFNGQANQRQTELDVILDKINSAKKFVYISVMNYSPFDGYGAKVFWPAIDNALRAAYAERRVQVKLFVAHKQYRADELAWYKSLNALRNNVNASRYYGSVEVNYYTIPKDNFQSTIPYSRLKHDKFIINENSVYIGTSNMQPSYYASTCGVGMSISLNPYQSSRNPTIVEKMKAIFERDYYSDYSHNIDEFGA